MITLEVDNRRVTINGVLPRRILSQLDKLTSYKVAGSHFAPSFRAKRWDGKEHLLTCNAKTGAYKVPVGMLEDVEKCLKEMGEPFVTLRPPKKAHKTKYGWNAAITMRDYQKAAVEALAAAGGSGILSMAIRSGKTKTTAWAIHELGPSGVLFIVPSQLLLYQTQSSLEESLSEPIGIIGDGQWDVKRVTVATVQSLALMRGGERKGKPPRPMDPRYKGLLDTEMVVWDECHHIKGESWRAVMLDMNARFKLGLSATALFANETEMERGVIWLKACCGPVRYEVSTSSLIEDGYLIRPEIRLYKVTKPDLMRWKWSQSLADEGIYSNPTRNAMIIRAARDLALKEDLKVLIVSSRLEHTTLLAEGANRIGIRTEEITSKVPHEERIRRIARFASGETQVLVGTVFGEGVDIPVIEAVINAEGGKDAKATVQRLRNLTPSPKTGKTTAIVVDFMDLTNPYFAEHSEQRLKTYRENSAFKFKLCR